MAQAAACRYVPVRRNHRGQSGSLTVRMSAGPQVSQSAGDSAAAPQTSQSDRSSSELALTSHGPRCRSILSASRTVTTCAPSSTARSRSPSLSV
jgi:hypothetical protein